MGAAALCSLTVFSVYQPFIHLLSTTCVANEGATAPVLPAVVLEDILTFQTYFIPTFTC